MSMVDRLIEQLRKRGLRVESGKEPGQLVLLGPNLEKTDAVLSALKKFKPQLLERYGMKTETMPAANGQHREPETNGEPDPEPEICRSCKRDVSDPENRQRLIGPNPFCQMPHCPYRRG